MLNLVPLVVGAGTAGIVHMAAPDHWVTLSVLGRSRGWTRSKVLKTSLISSIGHVALSLVLGIAVAAIGIVFSRFVSEYLDIVIGIVMVAVGLFVGTRPFILERKKDHDNNNHFERSKEKYNKESERKVVSNIGYFAVLGAALSPDPSIMPIFLASVPAGFCFLVELAIIFAISSVLTLILLVQLGNMGFAKALEKIPEKYNDSIVGFVIAAIGVFILVSGH